MESSPAASPRGHDVHEAVLDAERLHTGRRAAALRVLVVGLFLVNNLWIVFVLQARPVQIGLGLFAGYFGLSLAIWLAARRSDRFARASLLLMPLLDIPVVFGLQVLAARVLDPDEMAIMFTALPGVFSLIVVFSVLSLQARVVALGAVASAACVVAFDLAFEAPTETLGFGITMLAMAVAAALYLVRRIEALLRDAAERQTHRDRLRRFFSPQVARLVEEDEGADTVITREITILFADLRDFTALTRDVPSERVVEWLDEVHTALVEHVFAHGGTLDKFLGDGLMAVFNAPLEQPDHAGRAVRCAKAMHVALEEINAGRGRRGEPPLVMGIGIHTGVATLGPVGSPERREYTAIGETVNVASRIEELTRSIGEPILLTEATRDRLDADVPVELVVEAELRGLDEPTRCHRPVDLAAARSAGSAGP